jgi:hypothetical protein
VGWPVIFAVAFDAKHSSSMSRRSAHHYVGECYVIRIERLALLYSMIWNVTGEGLTRNSSGLLFVVPGTEGMFL